MAYLVSPKCWFLTGATASGKSAVGIELAQRIDAEIISLDSMALYRRMDIGTAKPTPEQRQTVSHHLIDVIEPHEEFSVARYIETAVQCVQEIEARGRQTLFVGGTPLYLKGLLRGIFEGPPADWAFRHALLEKAEHQGPLWLYAQLAKVDPATAARLHPNDTRRLIRALEVFEKTGRPISQLQQQFEVGRPAGECRVFVLDWSKAELDLRIDRRVDEMFAAGLVEEVRSLLADQSHPPLSRTARQAVGYREVIDHLEGKQGLAETITLVKQHTRQLAKRQNTWFRSLSECRLLPISGQLDAPTIIAEILSLGDNVR